MLVIIDVYRFFNSNFPFKSTKCDSYKLHSSFQGVTSCGRIDATKRNITIFRQKINQWFIYFIFTFTLLFPKILNQTHLTTLNFS